MRSRTAMMWTAPMILLIVTAPGLGESGWPQWRGPNRDGSSEESGLLKQWPEQGPPVAWQVATVGSGYASVAVRDGLAFTQGDVNGIESVICLSSADGSTRWVMQPEPVARRLQAQVAEEFRNIDASGDGRIDEMEALRRFGWDWNNFNGGQRGEDTDRRGEHLFRHRDMDQDGQLTFAEAGLLLRDAFWRADAEDKSADAKQVAASRASSYMQVDKDADGTITKEEAQGTEIETLFGQFDKPDPITQKGDELLTMEEITSSLLQHQLGRDGRLTRQELGKLYKDSAPPATASSRRTNCGRF